MKYYLLAILVMAGLTGCVETDSPTAPLLEQRVFTALGGLEVGEALSLTGEAAATVLLGASSAAGDFVIIPFHASLAQGSRLVVEIAGRSVGSPASSTAPEPSSGPLAIDGSVASWDLHEAMQERFRSAVQPLVDRRLRTSKASLQRALGVSTQLSGDALQVGRTIQLNTDVDGEPCVGVQMRNGRIEAVSEHAVIIADLGNPAGGFDRADYESFAEEFDTLVHPTIIGVFGTPTDIDENGRVIIFFTRAVNELTRPSDEGFVGGFFYARDLFPNSGVDPCIASNAGEMFYVLVPDPNAEASHIPHQRDDVFNGALGTIGHEYQHLINASRRIWVNEASTLEETWLNEALSHIGEELLFYAAAGIEPRSNVSEAHLQSDRLLEAINRFGVQNLIRYGLYLEDVTDDSPTDRGDNLATRGAAWSFLRYLGDHQQDRTDVTLFRELVDAKVAGFQNLTRALDEDPLLWVQRWGISVYTDDFVPSLAARPLYQQPSWDFRGLLPQLFGGFPLEVRTLRRDAALDFDIKSGTSGYVEFSSAPGVGSHVDITSNGADPPSQLRVTVVRTE